MNTEEMIIASGKNGPRVTPGKIQSVIKGKSFYVWPGTTLTMCCIELMNGFSVTGESACADPNNFDRAIGESIAEKNAIEKIWMLEGYALRERLFRREKATTTPDLPAVVVAPHDDLVAFVGTKIVNAKPMTRGVYNMLRGWKLPADENPSDEGFLVEYTDAQRPNVPGYQGFVSWSPKDVFESAYHALTATGQADGEPIGSATGEKLGENAQLMKPDDPSPLPFEPAQI